MEIEETPKPKQICTITVMFPVESDNEAMEVKKKIDDAVSETKDSRVDFRIMNLGPTRGSV